MAAPRPPFRARGWRADFRFLELVGTKEKSAFEETHRLGHPASVVHSEPRADGSVRYVFAPEIIIEAANRLTAQRALSLMVAAKTLLDGDFTTGDPPVALPDHGEPLEDLGLPDDYPEGDFWIVTAEGA